MNKLEELALKCERATGPDRELDCAISVALHGGEIVWKQTNYTMEPYPARRIASSNHVGGFANEHVPEVTASLDAAMTLVPERCAPWHCGRHNKTGLYHAYLTVGTNEPIYTMAATPALALAAASLRARSMKEGSHGEG